MEKPMTSAQSESITPEIRELLCSYADNLQAVWDNDNKKTRFPDELSKLFKQAIAHTKYKDYELIKQNEIVMLTNGTETLSKDFIKKLINNDPD